MESENTAKSKFTTEIRSLPFAFFPHALMPSHEKNAKRKQINFLIRSQTLTSRLQSFTALLYRPFAAVDCQQNCLRNFLIVKKLNL